MDARAAVDRATTLRVRGPTQRQIYFRLAPHLARPCSVCVVGEIPPLIERGWLVLVFHAVG